MKLVILLVIISYIRGFEIDKLCRSYDFSSNRCLNCYKSFYNNDSSSCDSKIPNEVENCIRYAMSSTTKDIHCKECENNFSLIEEKCEKCTIENCSKCSKKKEKFKCEICTNNKVPDEDGQCVDVKEPIENCLSYSLDKKDNLVCE